MDGLAVIHPNGSCHYDALSREEAQLGGACHVRKSLTCCHRHPKSGCCLWQGYTWAGTGNRAVKRKLLIIVAALGILYLGDFLSLRLSIPPRDSFGSVTVHTYYAVKLKNGKTEYDYAGDHEVSCSNSLLPQMGAKPCWYARRHTEEQITIDSGNPNNPRLF